MWFKLVEEWHQANFSDRPITPEMKAAAVARKEKNAKRAAERMAKWKLVEAAKKAAKAVGTSEWLDDVMEEPPS
jgi:hypothetical protein